MAFFRANRATAANFDTATIVLVPTGTTALCRRREPPVFFGESAGGE